MFRIDLDKIKRLAEYLTGRSPKYSATGSKLADARAGELLGNAAAAAQELLSVLGLDPLARGTEHPPDESSTLH